MAEKLKVKEKIVDGNPTIIRFLRNQGTSFFTKDKTKEFLLKAKIKKY